MKHNGTHKSTKIEREGLEATVASVLNKKLTIIHGPAGYGKTELLTQVEQELRKAEGATFWLKLDGSNVRPDQIIDHLNHALKEELNNDYLSRDTHRQIDQHTQSIRDIKDPPPSHKISILIDDYETIESPVIDDCLKTIINNTPKNIHFVISSRYKPSLNIEKLRFDQQLHEINYTELALTDDEMRKMLSEDQTILTDEQIEIISQTTENWLIGCQLALAMTNKKEIFDPRFHLKSILNQNLYDYFDEQVLSRLSETEIKTLLYTSIVDEFDISLANALLQEASCWHTLRQLVRKNIFIFASSSKSGWFRYHQLFRAFLIETLERREPGRIHELHGRAARWLYASNRFLLAIGHANRTADFDLVSQILIELGGWRMAFCRRLDVLREGLDLLPPDHIEASHSLELGRVLMLIKEGKVKAARSAFELIDVSEKDENYSFDAHDNEIMAIILSSYEYQDDLQSLMRNVERLIGIISSDDHFLNALLFDTIANLQFTLGSMSAALKSCEQAEAHYKNLNSMYGEIFVRFIIAKINYQYGNLDEAERLLKRTYLECSENDELAREHTSNVAIYLASTYYELDKLEYCRELLDSSLPAVSEGEGWHDLLTTGFELAVSLAWRDGGFDEVRSVLDRFDEVRIERGLESLSIVGDILHVRYLCRSDRGAIAEHFLDRISEFVNNSGVSEAGFKQLVVRGVIAIAEIHISNGRGDLAVELVSKYLGELRDAKQIRRLILLKMAHAKALVSTGAISQSAECLCEAVDLGIFKGFRRLYFDNCSGLEPALGHILKGNLEVPEDRYRVKFLESMLESINREKSRHLVQESFLSARQESVLKILNRGYSNKEIARELDISPNTVKFHMKDLFRKYDVNDRYELVRVYRDSLENIGRN